MICLVTRPRLLLPLLALLLLAVPSTAAARVMHGDDAAEGEFPWTVALVFPGLPPVEGQFCGGTLIDDDVVLTAAHCVMGSRADEVDVFAGEVDLTQTGTGQRRAVATVHLPVSAEVDPDSGDVPRRDMAVLKLTAPVTDPQSAIVAPVGTGVADDELWDDAGDDLEVMGWGLWDDPSSFFPDVLQHATIDRVSDEDCETAYGPDFFPTDMVCALGSTGPPDNNVVDTCGGDSGGPLTTNVGGDPTDPADWRLVGTTSFGSVDCDAADAPGVYARLDHPDLREFVEDFSDGADVDDPPAQIEQTGGSPGLTGVLEVGQQIACDVGDTEWSDDPVTAEPRVRLYDADFGELITVAVGQSYTLTDEDVGYEFLCEVHVTKTGVGGYGVARSGLSAPVPSPASGGGGGTTPPPPVVNTTIVQVLPPPPDPQPFVPEPRDEGVPHTSRVTRRCNRRTRRCTLSAFTADTTTAGAFASGVRALEVRLTTRYRCLRNGRPRTCISRRTLGARPALPPGRFTIRTPKLRRGRHTVRLTAIDANGNREPRPLTYAFRLR
jgi:trypsin